MMVGGSSGARDDEDEVLVSHSGHSHSHRHRHSYRHRDSHNHSSATAAAISQRRRLYDCAWMTAVLASALSLSVLLLCIIHANLEKKAGDGACSMSFSRPRYRRLSLHSPNAPIRTHYALYAYTDGFAKFTRVCMGHSISCPFL